jgi:hypothetical protein
LQLFFRAFFFVNSFSNQYWLDSGVAKDNSSGEEAIYDRDNHLDCILLVLAERQNGMVSRAASSPILFPLETSSRVYVDTTLGLLCDSGSQSLTGLKLILLCDIDSRVPSLPICIPSMELTRLKDIVGRPTG